MNDRPGWRTRGLSIACALLSLAAWMWSCASLAESPTRRVDFDIDRQRADKALVEFARQAQISVLMPATKISQVTTNAVHGSYAIEDALAVLLRDSGLSGELSAAGSLTIRLKDNGGESGMGNARKRNRFLGIMSLIAAALTTGGHAGAQDVSAAGTSNALEEITVTARKREESFINAPVVESVISQQTLEQYQTQDLFNLQEQVPGLLIGKGVGAFGPGVSIRGVGTTVETATVDESVLLTVDGMPLSQGLAYGTGMFDVGQVEVLKGPEALLYGKNSTGGVISLRTNDPTDKPEVILTGGYEAEAQEKLGEMIFSGPVNPWLKLRLAAHYSDDNGFFRNLGVAPDGGYGMLTPTTNHYDADQNAIIRGTALFNPTDNYDARLKLTVSYDFLNYGNNDEAMAACPFGLTSFTGLPIFDPHDDCKLGRNVYDPWMNPAYWPTIRNNGIPYDRAWQEFGTLEQNLHEGPFTFTSLTGFYEIHQASMENGNAGSGIITLAPDNDFSNHEFTQELRVTSDFQSPFNFMAGAYYENEYMVNSVHILANTGIPGVPLPGILQSNIQGVDVNLISGFGQLIYKPIESVEIDAGARLTHESRTHTEDNFDVISGPLGPTPLLDPHLSTTNVSPEATIAYRPNEDLTVFGSYKEGYKSGSFNTVVYYSPSTQSAFGDEKVKGGEMGLKSRFLDRRLSVNLDGYFYHYSGLQVGADQISPTGIIELNTLNAASANVKGLDLDVTYAPAEVEGLTFRTAVNYNIARYVSFPDAPCSNGQLISEGCNQLYDATTGAYTAQNLSGRPLTRAPDVTVVPSVDYQTLIAPEVKMIFGAFVTYTSAYYTALIDRTAPGYLQGAFAKTNLSLGFKGPNDSWEVGLIGVNITDKITAGHCDNAEEQGAVIFGGEVSGTNKYGPGGDDYPTCTPERGRELWLRFTIRPLAFLKQ